MGGGNLSEAQSERRREEGKGKRDRAQKGKSDGLNAGIELELRR